MASSRIADSVGRVLGDRYRLTRPLGVGASAHVYVAEDVTLRRRVAIKVLHPALAGDESFLRRFRAEARVVAALRHPNILTVYDWGEDGGSPYLVMELLEGGSLRSLLDRGLLLSPAQAAAVGADAARALDYAHRRSLVHRDVKPANLIFDDEGRVTVADFGLARALAEATWTEPSGSVVGTARYAAPEAVRGEQLDSKADVYALALVLVEATTGVVPFAADTTIGTLMGRVDRPLIVPTEAGPLGPVLEAAGTADPAQRLDAAGLARGLDRAAKQIPPAAPLPLGGPLHSEGVERDSDPTEYPGRPKLFDFAAADADPAALDFRSNPVRRVAVDPAPPVPAGRRRRRKLWVVLLVVLALLAGGGGFAVAEMQILTPSYPVPRVVGDSQAAAVAALGRDHLHLKVAGSRYDSAVAGTVLSQDPTGGRLKSGHSVAVVVSSGPQPVNVPDNLAGLSETAAQTVLSTLGLKLGPVTRASSLTVAEGLVIESTPDRGTLLPGRTVALVISTGKPIVGVPSLTSAQAASFAAAQAALAAVHLGAAQSQQFNNSIPNGHVIGLQPAAGTELRYGAEVTVLVSKGPDLVAIPSVQGLSVPAADTKLTSYGFVVSPTVGGTGSLDGTVIATNPPVGTMALKGATVQLITG